MKIKITCLIWVLALVTVQPIRAQDGTDIPNPNPDPSPTDPAPNPPDPAPTNPVTNPSPPSPNPSPLSPNPTNPNPSNPTNPSPNPTNPSPNPNPSNPTNPSPNPTNPSPNPTNPSPNPTNTTEVVSPSSPGFDDHGNYHDLTSFNASLNDWVFYGWWARYDLAQESWGNIPANNDTHSSMTLICKEFPTHLEKEFPGLENATLGLSYYPQSPSWKLGMKLTVAAGEYEEEVFEYTYPDDLLEHDATWVLQQVPLPPITRNGHFKLRLSLSSDGDSIFATDQLEVTGVQPTHLPIVHTSSQAPPSTTPEPVVTEIPPVITSPPPSPPNTTQPPTPQATEGPNTTTGGAGVPGSTSELSDNVGRLENVAQAIWDAFYVFLALFCACLVALVALIVRGRCRPSSMDLPPPIHDPPSDVTPTPTPRRERHLV